MGRDLQLPGLLCTGEQVRAYFDPDALDSPTTLFSKSWDLIQSQPHERIIWRSLMDNKYIPQEGDAIEYWWHWLELTKHIGKQYRVICDQSHLLCLALLIAANSFMVDTSFCWPWILSQVCSLSTSWWIVSITPEPAALLVSQDYGIRLHHKVAPVCRLLMPPD